ncbi:MAG: putative quinol monooxygenase [Cellvibrionaceae bacterium]
MKSELEKLTAVAREEKGCINYYLHQNSENPVYFLFYENWESHELWQEHMNNQHLKDYMTATEGAVEEFVVNEMTHLD